MNRTRILAPALAACAVAGAIGISASAFASSPRTDPNRQFAPKAQGVRPTAAPARGKTHELSLANSAFAPDNSGDSYENEWDPASLNQSQGCSNAGVTLPDNAAIKSVTVYYKSPGANLYFELNRQDLVHHKDKRLVDFTAKTHPAYTSTTKKVKSSLARVDYSRYAYGLGVCPDGDSFSGVTITYMTP